MNYNINIEIEEDDTDGISEALRNVADLIDRGFTSGCYPTWSLVEN